MRLGMFMSDGDNTKMNELLEKAGECISNGDIDEALKIYRKVIEISLDSGDSKAVALGHLGISEVTELTGDFDVGMEAADLAAEAARASKDMPLLADALLQQAEISWYRHRLGDARRFARDAGIVARANNIDNLEVFQKRVDEILDLCPEDVAGTGDSCSTRLPESDRAEPHRITQGLWWLINLPLAITGFGVGLLTAYSLIAELTAGNAAPSKFVGALVALLCGFVGIKLGRRVADFIVGVRYNGLGADSHNPQQYCELYAGDSIDSLPFLLSYQASRIPIIGEGAKSGVKLPASAAEAVSSERARKHTMKVLERNLQTIEIEKNVAVYVLGLIPEFCSGVRLCPKCHKLVPTSEKRCKCGSLSVWGASGYEYQRRWFSTTVGNIRGRQNFYFFNHMIFSGACAMALILDMPLLLVAAIPMAAKMIVESHFNLIMGKSNLVPKLQEILAGVITATLVLWFEKSPWQAFLIAVAATSVLRLPKDYLHTKLAVLGLSLSMSFCCSERDLEGFLSTIFPQVKGKKFPV